MRRLIRDPENRIDDRLRQEVGGDVVEQYTVGTKDLPGYRFVDMHRAIESLVATKDDVQRIETSHAENLNSVLHGEHFFGFRQISKPTRSWNPAASRP